MHKILKISDLHAILSHYSEDFAQEKVANGELAVRFAMRRTRAHPVPMAALRSLYERLLEAECEWLGPDDLREYAQILTAPELLDCPDLFAHDWTLSGLSKTNAVLRYFAAENALSDAVIKRLAQPENMKLAQRLLPILEHGKFYQFAINRPTLIQEQYLYLFDHHDQAHALAICFGMLALNNDQPVELNRVLFTESQVSEALRVQLKQINANCLEGFPWQNIAAGQPLTRAIDVLRDVNVTTDLLKDLLADLPNCETRARGYVTKDTGLQGNASLFNPKLKSEAASAADVAAGVQLR